MSGRPGMCPVRCTSRSASWGRRYLEIDRASTLYVICRSGNRSAYAARALAGAGWQAHNVADGMIGWQAAGRPMTSESGQPFVA